METKTIADAGGYAIFEKDDKWFFVNYGTFWFYLVVYLLIFVLTYSVMLSITSFVNQYLTLGVLFIGFSIFSIIGMVLVIKLIKAPRKKKLEDHNIIAVIDFKSKNLLDGNEKILAPLKEVKFVTAGQWFVSALTIKAKWNTGSLVIARGNIGTGGSPEFSYPMKKKGLMKAF